MKIISGLAATTHVDNRGERIPKEALQMICKQMNQRFMPFLFNHDPLEFPVGRIVKTELVQLPEDHWGIEATVELYEEGDRPDTEVDEGKEYKSDHDERFTLVTLSTTSSIDFQNKIKSIAEESGALYKGHGRKGMSLVDILSITGFAIQLAQISKPLLSKVIEHFAEKKRDCTIILKMIFLLSNTEFCEVLVHLDSGDSVGLSFWSEANYEILKEKAEEVSERMPAVRKIAFKADGTALHLEYVLLKNCMPVDDQGMLLVRPVDLSQNRGLSIGFIHPFSDDEPSDDQS